MSHVRIAVAGNQWITRFLINKLIEAGIQPSLVINCGVEFKELISGYDNLQSTCNKQGIRYFSPETYKLSGKNDYTNLKGIKIDILLVFGWQRLIPGWLIDHCRLGVFGVHGGPEKPPRCRGQAVFNWALILGYERFYMYMFKINEGVDSGDIIEICQFDITIHDDIKSLYHKNCIVSTNMFIRNIPTIIAGNAPQIPQRGEPTVLPKRRPENGGIIWSETAERIQNLIRALASPYPGAFSFVNKKRISIHTAHVFDSQIHYDGKPGEILEIFADKEALVMCGDQPIYLRSYSVEDGHRLTKGDQFSQKCGHRLPDPIV